MSKNNEQIARLSPEQLQRLADRLLANRKDNSIIRIMPRPEGTEFIPISYSQEGLLLLDRLGAGTVYNESIALRLEGPWDVAVLEEIFAKLVARHEILRTRIEITPEGHGVQIIDSAGHLKFDKVDLSSLTEEQQKEAVSQRTQAELQNPFDLGAGPLFRVALLRLSAQEHVLCVTAHHIIWDLWSLGVLLRELGILYTAHLSGKPAQLPPLEAQYADYVLWQRERLQDGLLERQLEYWREQLSGAPAILELPSDRPRPLQATYQGAHQWFYVSENTSSKLNELGRSQGATLYMVLLSAFQVLLSRWSGQHDIVVGSPISGRKYQPTEKLIGFFVNMLAVRTDLSDDPAFLELLSRVKKVTLEAFEHQDVPFDKLVAELHPERHLSHQPLFQVTFVLQNQGHELVSLPGLKMTPMDLLHETAKFDLCMEFFETEHGLTGRVEYATDLFEASTIERFTENFKTLLDGITADANQPISKLPLLSESEQNRLVTEWNQTASSYPREQTVHSLFEQQVALSPNAVAVSCGGREMTYRDLNARSNQAAHWLKKRGVKADSLVGLCVDRSIDMLIGMLGILKAGGAYVPIDSQYPEERIRFMVEDTNLEIILTQEPLLGRLSGLKPQLECVVLESSEFTNEPVTNPEAAGSADGLAYVMYTSGSTGQPKGACVTHRGINRLAKDPNFITISSSDNLAHYSSISFDALTLETWPALLNGARITIFSKLDALMPADFAQQLRQSSITIMWVTVALFNEYVRAVPGIFSSLRYVMFGGDAADPTAVRSVLSNGRPVHLLNGYGPTETTVFATTYLVEEVGSDARTVPIGQPISETQVYVLDEHLELVPEGVIGELYIGGDGLARGYHNRPGLTAERFLANPYGKSGSRMYRTGDRVRYLPDGNLAFIGRTDHQVKIRGFRVELGEIEAILLKQPSVRECTVVARSENGRKQLVAYLVPYSREEFDSAALRAHLLKCLPDYMVPAIFVAMDRLPVTPNGKLDRHALPSPSIVERIEEKYAAPRNEKEECLARVFAEVLRQERVGINDNFFELGGDSIIALQIVTRAGQAGLKLSLREMFEFQSVAELAEAAVTAPSITAEQNIVTGSVPLTPIQRWFFDSDPIDPDHFNLSMLFQCEREVKPELLKKAVQHLMAHHDALRLRYSKEGSEWRQHNAGWSEEEAVPFEHIDLSASAAEQKRIQFRTEAERLQASFSLVGGSLLRAALFDMGAGQPQQLLLIIHHIASDGVSWRILLEDLQTVYGQLERHDTVRLPAKTTSFKTWSERLTRYADEDTMQEEVEYWRSLPWGECSALPVDYPTGTNTVASAREVTSSLSANETRALLQGVQAVYDCQILDVLLTAFAEAFHPFTKQRVLPIHLEAHGREELFEDVDITRTVGWFTSTFPVLLERDDHSSFPEMVKKTESRLRKIPYRGIRYGLLRYLKRSCELTQLPEPEVVFNYLGQFDGSMQNSLFQIKLPKAYQPTSEDVGPSRSLNGIRRHLLEVNGLIANERLQFVWYYSEAAHSRSTIEALVSRFTAILQQMAQECSLSLVSAQGERSDSRQCVIEGKVPLTPIQRYCLNALGEGFRKNILVTVYECQEKLSPALLDRALKHLIVHHDALRLGLRAENSGWQQWSAGVDLLDTVSLTEFIESATQELQEAEFFQIADRLASCIDMGAPPLLRAAIIDFGPDRKQQLFLAVHHLGIDALSYSILIEDLCVAYEHAKSGVPISLPEKTTSYKKWAEHLTSFSQSPELHDEEEYWLSLPWSKYVPLPTDFPNVELPISIGETNRERLVSLDPSVTGALLRLQREHAMLLDECLLAVLASAVRRWTRQPVTAIRLLYHGRTDSFAGIDVSRTVGWFSTEIPIVLEIPPLADFEQTLQLVKNHMRKLPRNGIGYGVLRYLTENETLASLQAPEIRLNHLGRLGQAGGNSLLQSRSVGFGRGNSLDCLIELRTYIYENRLYEQWLYDERIYREDTMDVLVESFNNSLSQAIQTGQPVSTKTVSSNFMLSAAD